MSATGIIVDIVKAVIGKLSDKPAEWSVEKIAQAVADKATEALITVIAAELAKFQAALGAVLATHEVAEATQRVLEAMREAETRPKISIPSLLDITEVGPDEKIESTTVEAIGDDEHLP